MLSYACRLSFGMVGRLFFYGQKVLPSIIKSGDLQAWDGRGIDKFPRKGDKQLYDEINYHRAEKLTKKMLEKGLITADECDKILAESRKIFVPYLAEIL